MQVCQIAQVSAPFARIHELAAKDASEVNVVAAPAPVPVRSAGAPPPVIARTRLDGALGTRAGDRVGHRRAGQSENEGRFAATCGEGEGEDEVVRGKSKGLENERERPKFRNKSRGRVSAQRCCLSRCVTPAFCVYVWGGNFKTGLERRRRN